MVGMLGIFAQYERDIIRERIQAAKAALLARGEAISGCAPVTKLGYRAFFEKKQWVLRPLQGELDNMQYVYDLRGQGLTFDQIKAKLNEEKRVREWWILHKRRHHGKFAGDYYYTKKIYTHWTHAVVWTYFHEYLAQNAEAPRVGEFRSWNTRPPVDPNAPPKTRSKRYGNRIWIDMKWVKLS